MELGENFENLLRDAHKYIELRIDSLKLQAVENISQLSSDIFSAVIIFFLLFVAIEFMFTALMLLLAQYIGLLLAAFAIGVFLLLAALFVYRRRNTIFRDIFVSRFCKIFFNPDNNIHNEKE